MTFWENSWIIPNRWGKPFWLFLAHFEVSFLLLADVFCIFFGVDYEKNVRAYFKIQLIPLYSHILSTHTITIKRHFHTERRATHHSYCPCIRYCAILLFLPYEACESKIAGNIMKYYGAEIGNRLLAIDAPSKYDSIIFENRLVISNNLIIHMYCAHLPLFIDGFRRFWCR